jgi:inner membrane protein involved in colicin E2 resistance
MNSSRRETLEQMADSLLSASVSSGAIPEETARLVALRAMTTPKPAFPFARIAVVLVAAALCALFAASNAHWFSWLLNPGSIRPFDVLLSSLASVSFEKAAAAMAVAGGIVYSVYTIAVYRLR